MRVCWSRQWMTTFHVENFPSGLPFVSKYTVVMTNLAVPTVSFLGLGCPLVFFTDSW